MKNKYVLEVPEVARGCWAVLRRLSPTKPWVAVHVLSAGTLETEATNAYLGLRRRVRSGELALVDPVGKENCYRDMSWPKD